MLTESSQKDTLRQGELRDSLVINPYSRTRGIVRNIHGMGKGQSDIKTIGCVCLQRVWHILKTMMCIKHFFLLFNQVANDFWCYSEHKHYTGALYKYTSLYYGDIFFTRALLIYRAWL